MSLVCLDTNIIKWGILGEVPDTERPEAFTSRSLALVQQLYSSKSEFLLPTVVLGELLVRIPAAKHDEVLRKFDRSWRFTDYDQGAARTFSEIRARMKEIRELDTARTGRQSIARCELGPDAMIVATAIVNEVDVIYTGDENFVKLAQGFIGVEYLFDLDLPGQQQELWN